MQRIRFKEGRRVAEFQEVAFSDSPIDRHRDGEECARIVPICLMGTATPFCREAGEERAYLEPVCPSRPARNDG